MTFGLIVTLKIKQPESFQLKKTLFFDHRLWWAVEPLRLRVTAAIQLLILLLSAKVPSYPGQLKLQGLH